ncbi:hypothetical protein ABZW30_36085 [Kitasatospora sp. NPDC004669]
MPATIAGVGLRIDERDRRILTLMTSGATTRLRVGVQAARRGWL